MNLFSAAGKSAGRHCLRAHTPLCVRMLWITVKFATTYQEEGRYLLGGEGVQGGGEEMRRHYCCFI